MEVFFLKNSSLKLIHDVKKVDSFTDKNAQKKEEHVMLSTKHTKQTKYFQDSLTQYGRESDTLCPHCKIQSADFFDLT